LFSVKSLSFRIKFKPKIKGTGQFARTSNQRFSVDRASPKRLNGTKAFPTDCINLPLPSLKILLSACPRWTHMPCSLAKASVMMSLSEAESGRAKHSLHQLNNAVPCEYSLLLWNKHVSRKENMFSKLETIYWVHRRLGSVLRPSGDFEQDYLSESELITLMLKEVEIPYSIRFLLTCFVRSSLSRLLLSGAK
jgi:hypothetical protein